MNEYEGYSLIWILIWIAFAKLWVKVHLEQWPWKKPSTLTGIPHLSWKDISHIIINFLNVSQWKFKKEQLENYHCWFILSQICTGSHQKNVWIPSCFTITKTLSGNLFQHADVSFLGFLKLEALSCVINLITAHWNF